MPYLTLVLAAVAVAVSTATLVAVLRLRAGLREHSESAVVRADRLAEVASRPPPPPESVKDDVAALRREVAEAAAALSAAIERLPRPEPPPPPPRVRVAEEVAPLVREAVDVLSARLAALEATLAEERTETAAELVARLLAERGFSRVTFVEGPVREGDLLRAVVEARRDGMAFKGPVILEGREVLRENLRPAYPMFP